MIQGKNVLSSANEMPGVENLSRLNAALKHEEAIQRHIEEGNLSPHEIALYVLENGSTGQKISTLQHIDRTFKSCNEKQVTQILHVVNDSMWTQDLELQVAAPAAFIPVLPMLSQGNLLLLLNGAQTMLEVRTEDVRKAWNLLVVELVGVMEPKLIISEIVPLAMKKADHSEPQDQRTLCCSLIGKAGSRLSPQQMVDTVLQKALALCQDTDAGVRVAMCDSLADVARSVGLEVTKDRITQELFELLVDEEKLVSRAAFTCLIDLVEFFDPPYRREHFYPIIRSYISSPPDEVLTLLIEEFGRFLWKIRSDIQGQEDTILFANFFRQCAQKADQEVRRMCAFNLPAVVASLPRNTYATHITQVTRGLAVDTHPPVRRAIAAGLHELFVLLGEKASYFLKEPFASLLSDPTVEVRSVLVENLDPMLRTFAASLKGEEREAFFQQITPSITNYELAVQKDWRKVSCLFKSFHSFPEYFSGQVVFEKFLPILVRHLQFGAAALKAQCAEFIVHFSKKIDNNQLVVDIFSRTISETFGRSTSCHNRISYIKLFEECCTLYSRKFVRDRMAETLAQLAEDHVPKVRVALVRALPTFKALMRPPVEDDFLKFYQKALQKLQADHDEDVIAEMALVEGRLDELEREFTRQQALRTTNASDEAAEKKREESEGNLLELAKEQEKTERRQKIREMLKNERETMAAEAAKRPGAKRPTRPGVAPTRPTVHHTTHTSSKMPTGKTSTATRRL